MTRPAGYFVDKANQFISDVLDGSFPACKWVKLACQRQLDDLSKTDFAFKFDITKAERVCQFIEFLPHVKGDFAARRENFELQPFQCFILTTIFGWLNSDGHRRFRISYTEIPRKNGKSPIASGVALYCLLADGETGAEVYTAASMKDQAKICFLDAKQMLRKSPDLCQFFGVEYNNMSIYNLKTNSFFRSLSKDMKGSLDGLNVHCAVVDELHAHRDASTWNNMLTARAARKQPLIFAITTAGFNRDSICYEQHDYTKKVLERVYVDESFFGIIFSVDDSDDWRLPSSWIKANPNYGVSVEPKAIEEEATRAMNSSVNQNAFLTKHLNIWVNSDVAWLNMLKWDACEDKTLLEENFKDADMYVSCDLAVKHDFCCVMKMFTKTIDEKVHYYAFPKHYQNQAAIDKSIVAQMKSWQEQGFIDVEPGEITQFGKIQEDIIKICKQKKPVNLGFDRYQAQQMMQNIIDAGIKNTVEYPQNKANMSAPMKEFEAAVVEGRFHHNGDPVFKWMVSNVIARVDEQDNLYPVRDKKAKHQKIDAAIATIMAIGLSMHTKPKVKKYEMFVMG